MLLTLLVTTLSSSAPCSLSGTVELTREGKKVDPGGRVALYVEKVPGAPVHMPQTWAMYQRGLQFSPQVLVVTKGDSVKFTNEDKEEHSVFSADPYFDFAPSKAGVTGSRVFRILGPTRIQCERHSPMRADVLVVENQFFTLANKAGTFRIEGLPANDYTLVAWEPNGGNLRVQLKACDGETRVAPLVLNEQAPQKVQNKYGAYGEYAH